MPSSQQTYRLERDSYNADLLEEKLSYEEDGMRHLEDDLEDIASIPVSKQLLRPSRSNLQNYINSSRSNTPSNFDGHQSYQSQFDQQQQYQPYYPPPAPPPEPPQSQQRSRIPRSKSQSSLHRATSSHQKKLSSGMVVGEDVRSEEASHRGIGGSNGVAVGRGHPSGPNVNGRGYREEKATYGDQETGPDEEGGTWEVLQPAGGGGGSGHSRTPSRSVSAPLSVRSQPIKPSPTSTRTQQSSQKFPSSSPPGPASVGMSMSKSAGAGSARSRAQTNNLLTSRAPPNKPKTSTTSPAKATPRRRAQSTSAGKALSYEAPTDIGPLPPWAQATPSVYKNEETGGFSSTGRPDQLVLPAVARRLEAARLAALGDGMNDQDLIHSWDSEGRPIGYSTLPANAPRRQGQSAPPILPPASQEQQPPPPSAAHPEPSASKAPQPQPLAESNRLDQNPLRPKRSFASLSVIPSSRNSSTQQRDQNQYSNPHQPSTRDLPSQSARPFDSTVEMDSRTKEKVEAMIKKDESKKDKDANAGCCSCTIM